MILKYIKHTIFVLFITSVSSSCGYIVHGVQLKGVTVENRRIPKEFPQEETTLICTLINKKAFDNRVKKNFEKYYKGDYLFLPNI